jgi:hypothetical protein
MSTAWLLRRFLPTVPAGRSPSRSMVGSAATTRSRTVDGKQQSGGVVLLSGKVLAASADRLWRSRH